LHVVNQFVAINRLVNEIIHNTSKLNALCNSPSKLNSKKFSGGDSNIVSAVSGGQFSLGSAPSEEKVAQNKEIETAVKRIDEACSHSLVSIATIFYLI